MPGMVAKIPDVSVVGPAGHILSPFTPAYVEQPDASSATHHIVITRPESGLSVGTGVSHLTTCRTWLSLL